MIIKKYNSSKILYLYNFHKQGAPSTIGIDNK